MSVIEIEAEVEVAPGRARCADGTGQLTALFFSEDLGDIARAKAFCRGCEVRSDCLAGAVERVEPWGVWGGELVVNGRISANRRRRGRPPKEPRAEVALPDTWELTYAEIA
ncbi:MAG: transcriptional regulator [Actinobacteria bacterium]|nr:WhiB family transcriptional regulator [Acidimicrobiia bacterium]PHX59973.1 MAG: transcriptional regulator [Actinomycetota bacterium]